MKECILRALLWSCFELCLNLYTFLLTHFVYFARGISALSGMTVQSVISGFFWCMDESPATWTNRVGVATWLLARSKCPSLPLKVHFVYGMGLSVTCHTNSLA